MNMKQVSALVLAGMLLSGISAWAEGAFEFQIKPILRKYCYGCHGPEKQKGKLRLDTLELNFERGQSAERWHDALDQVATGEMPPEDEPQPTAKERQTLTNWIRFHLDQAAKARRSTGGQGVMRRLTRYEYANTMRDLIGLDLDYAGDLPPEPASEDGFRNNGQSLGISADQLEYYLKIARDALGKAIVEGEQPEVIQSRIEKNTPYKNAKPPVDGNALYPGAVFQAKLNKFPREGEFVLRVHTSASIPEEAGIPQMKITIGVKADVRSPSKTLVVTDVHPDRQVLEFRGRIENFPLPGHNPKFPGLSIKFFNEYDDGSGFIKRKPKKQKKPKKGEKPKLVPVDPDQHKQPQIHIHAVEFEGPVFDTWPPSNHVRLVGKPGDGSEVERANRALQKFMTLAYRRPAKGGEVEGMLRLFGQIRKNSSSYESAMRETLALVLVTPEFLYLLEPSPGKRRPLTDFEIATRLSYFLWSTMPDEELFSLAQKQELRKPEVLKAQVQRLLADSRSWNFVENFADQWLNLSGIQRVAVNPQFHPKFDNQLKEDMRLETLHFFAEILRSNTSALQLIDSEFTMVNHSLAKHYKLPNPPMGSHFQKVSLKDVPHRGGLLTQGSILLANSDGEQSHPIRRAVWLLDRVLGSPPAPPPPDVPSLDANASKTKNLSIREKMKIHRDKAACADCHKDIDPWGIAFEQFDAVGSHRESWKPSKNAKPVPVDAKADLPDGSQLDGMDGLKQHLLTKEKGQFAKALTHKIMAYSLGRTLEYSDQQSVENLAKRFEESHYQLQSLITELVLSEEFLTR